ncbi:MAG TPA: heme ABC exporter ATP-binding protein CcmA [Chloroflexota bacterium]|nr:heme ABC exporter ATP-binding protein CcmA [Chloroflexota bacterium]
MAVASRLAPSIATDLAFEIEGLVRRYGYRRALDGLDLVVPWNQRVAILGPNGAGKTTLLRILATLVRPTRGQVRVGGLELPSQASAVRRYVGFLAHQTFLYDELTARENLIFYGHLYGLPDPSGRADALLAQVGLADRAGHRVRTLSRGLQQRLALARAVVHDPPLLLLDEPETGLDLAGIALLGSLFYDATGHLRTVLFTTHDPELALALADRVIVLARGRKVFDRPASELTPAVLAAVLRGEGEIR